MWGGSLGTLPGLLVCGPLAFCLLMAVVFHMMVGGLIGALMVVECGG